MGAGDQAWLEHTKNLRVERWVSVNYPQGCTYASSDSNNAKTVA